MTISKILCGFCLLFVSCNDESLSTPIVGNTPIPRIMISIIDKQGNDLLDPNNPDGYKHDDIELYADSLTTIKRCENWEFIFRHYDNPDRWFMLVWSFVDLKKFRPEFNDTLYCATSYLKLNDTTIDIIYSEYAICGHIKSLVTSLYNGEDLHAQNGTIIK